MTFALDADCVGTGVLELVDELLHQMAAPGEIRPCGVSRAFLWISIWLSSKDR